MVKEEFPKYSSTGSRGPNPNPNRSKPPIGGKPRLGIGVAMGLTQRRHNGGLAGEKVGTLARGWGVSQFPTSLVLPLGEK